MMLKKSILTALAVAGLSVLPLAASAERTYPGGTVYPQSTYPQDRRGWDQRDRWDRRDRGTRTLDGRVTGFSPFNLDVAGAPHIRLHNGTIINPTGADLRRGEHVTVFGHPNSDGTFEADRIEVTAGNGFNNGYGRTNNRRYLQ
jgi:hypothetical protein